MNLEVENFLADRLFISFARLCLFVMGYCTGSNLMCYLLFGMDGCYDVFNPDVCFKDGIL